jgi:hypothetical protein
MRDNMGLKPSQWKLLGAGREAQVPGLAQGLANALPTLSTAWLLLGVGTAEVTRTPQSYSRVAAPSSLNPSILYLPFVDVPARASFVSSVLAGAKLEQLPLQPYLSKPDLNPPKDSLLIEVEGDSMAPTLMPKDVLLIAPVPIADWRFLSGGVYMVVYGQDHLVVKRVQQNMLATQGYLRLVSDNPGGGELDLPGGDINGIFRVLAITRQL